MQQIIIRLRRKAEIIRIDGKRRRDLMLEAHAQEMLSLLDILEARLAEDQR